METPTISSYAMNAKSYGGVQMAALMGAQNIGAFNQQAAIRPEWNQQFLQQPAIPAAKIEPKKEQPMANARRLVKVLIIDPDENVPLDKALLYRGEEKFTDLTDQELFFDVDIKSVLEKHNEIRSKLRNKTVKEREEFLEPARIRDLRMTVVCVASF